jgi:hypothetical protein
MKKTSIICSGLVLVVFLSVAATQSAGTGQKISPLVGTWELVSEKWDDAQEFTAPPPGRKSYKFITPTHFVWTWVDPNTKKISNSMGGTYRHEGDSYVETPEFAFEGMEAYVGKEQKFTAKIQGDQWTHSGKLSEGQTLTEIWKRVK